ncbi:MAG: hypothetical protein JNN08_26265 [Bryobacterales bacterium]|nr:hypothetical protein [Bryobacterales bacterium]
MELQGDNKKMEETKVFVLEAAAVASTVVFAIRFVAGECISAASEIGNLLNNRRAKEKSSAAVSVAGKAGHP